MSRFCECFSFNLDPASSKLLRLLISIDLLLICIHVLVLRSDREGFLDSIWCLEQDGGVGEIFQYAKELWVVLIFILLTVKQFHLNYLTWAVLFAYLLVDDAFQLHETVGTLVASASTTETIAGLRAEDADELIVYAVFGILAIPLITITLSRCNGEMRTICLRFIFIMALVFCTAVIADVLHARIIDVSIALGLPSVLDNLLYYGLGVVEDGGEPLVVSLASAYAFNVFRRSTIGVDQGVSLRS